VPVRGIAILTFLPRRSLLLLLGSKRRRKTLQRFEYEHGRAYNQLGEKWTADHIPIPSGPFLPGTCCSDLPGGFLLGKKGRNKSAAGVSWDPKNYRKAQSAIITMADLTPNPSPEIRSGASIRRGLRSGSIPG